MRRGVAYLLLLLISAACAIAVVKYGNALWTDSEDARKCYESGVIRIQECEYDKAIADFTEAIRFDPKLAKAHYGRGVALGCKGNNDKAIGDFKENKGVGSL